MNILTNRDIRYFFYAISIMLAIMIITGIALSQIIISDFKIRMIAHDYKVAGYLLEQGAEPAVISAALTSVKTEAEYETGKELLQKLGYKNAADKRLLPEINDLAERYVIITIVATFIFGIFILAAFFLYFNQQQKLIQAASDLTRAFMDGNDSVRLDSEKEGSLFGLFASVNGMMTSLHAHIEAEKHRKDFLQDTISDISHQLKTPLAAMKMYNEIMQEETANPATIKEYTLRTGTALERMETLIQNLLKVTRLDAGMVVMAKKQENIRELIKQTVSEFQTRAELEEKSILQEGTSSAALFCDRDWMTEAIGNLIKNALDHMKAGGQVCVSWQETTVLTRISVRDNGSGIHLEDIHHVFKRFYRSRFSKDTEGAGLGLSLAKSIVEANSGTISVSSELHRGSTFVLEFVKLTEL